VGYGMDIGRLFREEGRGIDIGPHEWVALTSTTLLFTDRSGAMSGRLR
jgi:hypothetical protein